MMWKNWYPNNLLPCLHTHDKAKHKREERLPHPHPTSTLAGAALAPPRLQWISSSCAQQRRAVSTGTRWFLAEQNQNQGKGRKPPGLWWLTRAAHGVVASSMFTSRSATTDMCTKTSILEDFPCRYLGVCLSPSVMSCFCGKTQSMVFGIWFMFTEWL